MLAEMLRRLHKKPPPLHREALSLWIDTVGAEGVHVDEAKALHFMYGINMKQLLKRTQPKAVNALVAMGKAAARGELGSDDGAYALTSPASHAHASCLLHQPPLPRCRPGLSCTPRPHTPSAAPTLLCPCMQLPLPSRTHASHCTLCRGCSVQKRGRQRLQRQLLPRD